MKDDAEMGMVTGMLMMVVMTTIILLLLMMMVLGVYYEGDVHPFLHCCSIASSGYISCCAEPPL